MYTQIWNKYLPIIKILMKKSIAGDQTLNLNLIDFERAGIARKSGHKFNLQISNGRIDNVFNSHDLVKDFAVMLLQDEVIKDLCTRNDYQISMNTKYQLSIQYIARVAEQEEVLEEVLEHEG